MKTPPEQQLPPPATYMMHLTTKENRIGPCNSQGGLVYSAPNWLQAKCIFFSSGKSPDVSRLVKGDGSNGISTAESVEAHVHVHRKNLTWTNATLNPTRSANAT
ncbi:hypothetical protein M9H77_29958 [Catharanthus roseus]|uniref:Uncharacterized protein n=1 Tax=Catharanthus roseus TaxID=4058 RepID=A0ACB9ZZS7_CATRO|nr:hypothetical protein M9H77_29958 [Catharanthus roseus]